MQWTVRAVSRSALAATMTVVVVSSTAAPLLQVEAAPPTLCKATSMQSKSFPQLRSIPWLKAIPGSAGITAHLFYASRVTGKAAMMHTHGRNPGGRTTKVLWLIDNPADDNSITIDGKNLTGLGKTHQVFPGAGGGIPGYDDFPSIVEVPTAGCWRFQVTGGDARAAVTIRVVR
jgi:hypothetical protein